MKSHPLAPIKTFLKKLKDRHNILCRKLDNLLSEVEEIGYWIQTIEDNPKAISGLLQGLDGLADDAAKRAKLKAKLARQAREGIRTLDIRSPLPGVYEVQIDGERPFLLTKRLSELLRILAEATRESPDQMVGWKSKEHIASRLNQVHDKHTQPAAVSNLVYRLRYALRTKGVVDEGVVEVDRKSGIRLRLRRPGLDEVKMAA